MTMKDSSLFRTSSTMLSFYMIYILELHMLLLHMIL